MSGAFRLDGDAMKAQGILRHHFWGEYCADIILKFETKEDCEIAIELFSFGDMGTFRNACGGICKSNFSPSAQDPSACLITAAGDTLEKIILKLVSYGADRKKIESLAKSIDHGEMFYFEIPRSEVPNKNQMELF